MNERKRVLKELRELIRFCHIVDNDESAIEGYAYTRAAELIEQSTLVDPKECGDMEQGEHKFPVYLTAVEWVAVLENLGRGARDYKAATGLPATGLLELRKKIDGQLK